MRHYIFTILLLLALSPTVSLAQSLNSNDTLYLAVTDVASPSQLERQYGKFRELLQKKSGIQLKFIPIFSRSVIVEALNEQRVDLVITGPAEYVVVRGKSDAYPLIGIYSPINYSVIVTVANNGIYSISDLNNSKIALGEIGSASAHLMPLKMLNDCALKLNKSYKVVHASNSIAWQALKNGEVDALAFDVATFENLKKTEKEFKPYNFKVLARSADLPEDVLLVASHVKPAIVEKLRNTLIKHEKELLHSLFANYNPKLATHKFNPKVLDKEYDLMRQMYKLAGFEDLSLSVGEG